MPKKVKVLVLRTAGTNCDNETVFAFKRCGADADLFHIQKLFRKEIDLDDYHILVIPGGFSYGDDIAAGKILANEFRLRLGDAIKKFIDEGKLIIGICNGFQILVKAGILPGPLNGQHQFKQTATLMNNDCGKFEDRWVHLEPSGQSVWTKGLKNVITLPVAHGEGKFVTQDEGVLKKIKEGNQVVFRYVNAEGKKPIYPENPNGSVEDIAGICDKTGRVLGLMPHPERHFLFHQHPQWTRLEEKSEFGDGAKIFQNGVEYAHKTLL